MITITSVSRDVMQVCSDNETPFTLPEPIAVDNCVTPEHHHHDHPHQQQQQQQQQQQVLESRDQQNCPAPVTQTNGTRQPVTSSRPSTVKVSDGRLITTKVHLSGCHRETARFFVQYTNIVNA